MFKIKLQKFEILANLIHNSFVNNKNIIIFIGNSGTFLAAINNNKFIDSLFITLNDQNNLELYKYFLKKYSNFYVFFLHDDKSCELRHELIPVLQSVVKINPVEKFIDEHFLPTDISAFCIYDIANRNGEVWDTIIAKAPYQEPLSNIINYLLENSFKLGGIYFLNLEYISIIDKILQKSNNPDCSEHLQLFAYITRANEIKFVVKHKKNIISVKSAPYPVDRTELYVQGIIEQEIGDYLISLKSYISRQNLKVCMVFLCSESLKNLLLQSKFEPHKIICLSNEEISRTNLNETGGFSDNVIVELFSNNKTFLSFNKSIKSITQVNLINFLLFKPLTLIVMVLVVVLLNIKFWTYRNIKEIEALDAQNYQILQEYRNVRQRYPDIKDVANVADLYSLTALLKVPIITPFGFLEKFISNLPSNIKINKISWRLVNPDNIVQSSEYVHIDISLKYIAEDISLSQGLTNLENYVASLRKSERNFTIYYQTDKEITSWLGTITIPVSLQVIGPKES